MVDHIITKRVQNLISR